MPGSETAQCPQEVDLPEGGPVWASQAIGLITDLPPAAGLVEALAARAADAPAGAGGH